MLSFLIATIGFSFAVGKNYLTTATIVNASSSPTPQELFYGKTSTLPNEVTYFVLFQQLQEINAIDVQNRSQNQATQFKQTFYENRLGLQDSQMSNIDTIISNCFNQIRSLDHQAQSIINDYRALTPNGELKKRTSTTSSSTEAGSKMGRTFEPLPPIPASLGQLQAQKDQLILNARNQIRSSLGNTEFEKFDAAVENNATRILVPINSFSTAPRSVPTPNPTN